ncbi:helix-turn-helix transcriptional regulator [Gordonia sp. ABSL49_1]|uniref:helix-turn-helix transcriptional regulator n=1 Tax=unclassified Gordonia (in: high G+C Gram-positive bacteria) TaxID=2657482 RepID=UPI001F0D7127|nr:helix-turn-helix transcriptional regulator [Gordonia sp. ABSL49_1]MCH5642906.1 helix-turn-helix transcriptional regulator [Gordonia sp. ABSL49_1]
MAEFGDMSVAVDSGSDRTPARPEGRDGNELTGRQALRRAGVNMADCTEGCVIVGDAGSGRTTALRALHDAYAGDAMWLTGVARTTTGVFGSMIDDAPATEAAVRTALAGRSAAAVFIDDVDLLDAECALVVLSLVVHHVVPVYLSCRRVAPAEHPAAITALWKDGYLRRYDLRHIDADDVAEYIRSALGLAPVGSTVRQVLRYCGGSPTGLVAVVATATEHGTWNTSSGLARIDGMPPVTTELADRLTIDLADLGPGLQQLVALLGACSDVVEKFADGWLPLAALTARSDIADLIGAERRGIIEARNRHVRLRVPALARSPAGWLGCVERHHLVGSLSDEILAVALPDPECGRAALVACALRLDGPVPPTPALRSKAASHALRWGDPHMALLMLGSAQSGRVELAASPTPIEGWARLHLGDTDGVHAMLGDLAARDDPQWRSLAAVVALLGESATGRAPHADAAIEAGGNVGAWVGLFAAVREGLAGHSDDAAQQLRFARSALADDGATADGTLVAYLDAAEIAISALSGNATHACTLGERALRSQDGRGRLANGVVVLASAFAQWVGGNLRVSADQLREVVVEDVPEGWTQTADGLLRQIESRLSGQRPEPSAGDFTDNDPGGPVALRGVRSALRSINRAWWSATAGDVDTASAVLLDSAAAARDRGELVSVIVLCELALRFGAAPDAAHLAQLVGDLDADPRIGDVVTDRARLLVEHAVAWRAYSGADLERVALRHTAAGRGMAAADVMAQAAYAHRRDGDRFHAIACTTRTRTIVDGQGSVSSPAMGLVASENVRFTKREHEIVRLVVAARSNREIADVLGVSVRTVEGHVLRACGKTGARNRRELVELFTVGGELR